MKLNPQLEKIMNDINEQKQSTNNPFDFDLIEAMSERDQKIAEASGRYIVQYLEKEFQKRESDAETSLKKSNRSTMIASLLGAAFGVILTTVVNYFFNQ